VLDAVSAKLDTQTLIDMNERVDVDNERRERVVREWLSGQQGLSG
jgi:glycine betaine/choline ABC-type transport system substrate-binding protein